MFTFDFMRDAFAASGVVAILAGVVGYFLVLRGQTFAGHALSHVGFTGGAGAVMIGLAPFPGMVLATLLSGVAMGALGERLSSRDVAIGMTLSVALGLGLLFLHFYTAFATQASSLLFGNVLGVDPGEVLSLAVLACVSLAALGAIMRPLLFATLQPELAEAKGAPVRGLGIAFLAIVAVAVAESSQVVGALLVFTLMVGPASAARNLTPKLISGLVLSACFALIESWAGLALAWETDWPVSFWIVAISTIFYLASFAPARLLPRTT